jgi:hypothetical protein
MNLRILKKVEHTTLIDDENRNVRKGRKSVKDGKGRKREFN